MRNAILLGILLAMLLRLGGAQRVTVRQLEQMLASGTGTPPSAGESDLLDQITREDSLSPRVAALELTERLTAPTLARLTAQYKLGPLTQSAMELLADRSALLEPPPDEWLDRPPPDEEAQRRLIAEAGVFVFDTLAHLPNFFAVRTTRRFDDGPIVLEGQGMLPATGLHPVSSSRREITFREGKEIVNALSADQDHVELWEDGLQSQGEFGSEAAIVMFDVGRGPITFHHWESGSEGPVAVFHYSVPRQFSHYQVDYACRVSKTFHDQPGYHGSLTISGTKGNLVRMTLEVESKPEDPISSIASVIEYGPITLGGRPYTCPLRSLAFTRENNNACGRNPRERKLAQPIDMLNRSTFSDYHRLGSDAVIVTGKPTEAQPSDFGPPELSPQESAPGTQPEGPPKPATKPATQPPDTPHR